MATNLKYLLAIPVIAGSCLSFSFFTSKAKNPIKTNQDISQEVWSEIKTISKKLPQNLISREKGNCSVEELSKDSRNLLLSQEKGENFYIEIFCEHTNENTGKGTLPPHWTGLLPEEVLVDSSSLSIGKKFTIKTETISTDLDSKTTFKSSALKTVFEGTWGSTLKTEEGHSTIPISLPEDSGTKNRIYLIYY